LCILVVLPTFIAGMSDQSHLANTPNKGLTLSFSGISWPNLSYWTLLNIKDHDHQKEMIRTLRTCSDDWRWQQFQLWFGRFYFQFNPAPADDRSPDDVLEFFEHKKEVISGAVSGMQIYKDMSTQEIYKRTSRYTGEMLEAVHEGIGMTAGLTDSDIPEGSMMDPYDLFAVRGFGRATAQNINRFRAGNLIETNQIMTSYPTSLRYAFAEGYGCGLAFNFPLQVNRVIAIIHDEFDEQYADVIEMYYLKYLDDYHPGLTCDYF
ncbi:hypothetical protein JW979_07790, partial [bacterium]|nr:hypothetical protein [candidate division CSSED10-310 bacterium]